MNNYKLKIAILIWIPVILLSLWWLALLNILFSNKNKTSILEASPKKQTSINQNNHHNIPNKKDNNTSKNISSSKNKSPTKKNKITILNIYLPKKFKTLWFKKIKENLRKRNIIIKINTNLNDNQLLRYLAVGKIDIALIPSTKLSKFKAISYNITFNNRINLNSIFHFIFNNFLNSNSAWRIPYCIDPSATLVSPDINIQTTKLSNIKNYFLTYPNKITKITVNIWLDNIITKIYFNKNKYPYENFADSLYMFIYYSVLWENPNIISTIINWSTNKYIKLFSSINLIRYSNKYKSCKDNLDICLWKSRKTKIIFGFLSDINYLKTRKANIFPNENTNIYFVKWRWFIINKKTKNLTQALIFINEYLKQWTNGDYQLWNNCLSAFNNIYERQKFINKYVPFTNQEENFVLLTNTTEKLKSIFKKTKFLDAILWKYSLKALYETSNFPEIVLEN